MGLIKPRGENLLDFLEMGQVLLTYDGDLRDPLWWPQEGQSTCKLIGGLSGFLSRRSRGLKHCVESVPEPEDSSPVLTWNLGYFWVFPGESVLVSSGGLHVCFPLELYQQCHAGLRPCVASVPGPENSSPVLTWILGYF